MDAVDYAIAIAQRNEAELTALYVVLSPTALDYTSDTPEDRIPATHCLLTMMPTARRESTLERVLDNNFNNSDETKSRILRTCIPVYQYQNVMS